MFFFGLFPVCKSRLRSQKTDELPTIPQLRDRARKASGSRAQRPAGARARTLVEEGGRCSRTRDRLLHGQTQHAPPTTSPARSRRRAQGRQGSLRPDSEPVAQEALGFGIPAASDLRTQRARARHGRTACQLSVYWHDKQPIVWSVFPSSVSAAAPIEVARHTGDIRPWLHAPSCLHEFVWIRAVPI